MNTEADKTAKDEEAQLVDVDDVVGEGSGRGGGNREVDGSDPQPPAKRARKAPPHLARDYV